MNGRAECDHFIGIQLAMRRAFEVIAYGFADERDARGAADEDDFVHFLRGELRVGEGQLHGSHGARDDGTNQAFEFGASEFATVGLSWRDSTLNDRFFARRKLMFCADECAAQFLDGFAVAVEFHAEL